MKLKIESKIKGTIGLLYFLFFSYVGGCSTWWLWSTFAVSCLVYYVSHL